MKDKTVAILESRMRDHIASLVRKYGGTPFSVPALADRKLTVNRIERQIACGMISGGKR
jgi:hypothetical protein